MLALFLAGLFLPSPRHVSNRGIRDADALLSDGVTEQIDNLRVHASALSLRQRFKFIPQVGGESDTYTHFFCLHDGIRSTAFCIYCTRYRMVVKCIHNLMDTRPLYQLPALLPVLRGCSK